MLVHDIMRDIDTIATTGKAPSLTTIYEVEDVVLALREINKKVERFKGLKKYRADSITAEINKWEARSEVLRSLILSSMQSLNEKSFNFPDVGKVNVREIADSIEIVDDAALLAYFDKNDIGKDAIIVSRSLDKRKAKKIVAELQSSGVNVPGVEAKKGNSSLSVTFESPSQDKALPTPKKNFSLDDLDSLDL